MISLRNCRPLYIVLAVVAVVALWAAFRPELLFVNKTVNDPFPTSASAVSYVSTLHTLAYGTYTRGG